MARTLPQYKCIEGDLLEQIQAGVYKKGDHIPPEQTLSRQYGVSRVTVRKALKT
ncbi:MAG: GntR family transcriptional regulator [Ruthenibacterium lactatiformans]